jgi:hypothetical protein
VQVVGSAFNDGIGEKMLNEFIAQFKPAFPIGWNTRVAVWSFVQYSILSQKPLYVPHMAFIDRGGVIRAEYKGEEAFFQAPGPNIRKELDKMLAAPHTAPAKPAPKK